jgi:hypothetical protein
MEAPAVGTGLGCATQKPQKCWPLSVGQQREQKSVGHIGRGLRRAVPGAGAMGPELVLLWKGEECRMPTTKWLGCEREHG